MEIRGHIVDVLDRRIYDGAIEVEEGKISCIRPEELPSDAPYILPGFIDAFLTLSGLKRLRRRTFRYCSMKMPLIQRKFKGIRTCI